jgi:hypothetical protein
LPIRELLFIICRESWDDRHGTGDVGMRRHEPPAAQAN